MIPTPWSRRCARLFVAALDGQDLTQALDFYGSDLGRRIVTLEIAARASMLDPTMDAASKDCRDRRRPTRHTFG